MSAARRVARRLARPVGAVLAGALGSAFLALTPMTAAAAVSATAAVPATATSAADAAVRPAIEATPLPIQVSLEEITTTAVDKAGTFLVAGRIRNSGPSTLDGITVTLRADDSALTTRAAVTAWATGTPTGYAGRTLDGTRTRVGSLAPGATSPFQLSVPGAVLAGRFAPGSGPHGIAVAVTERPGGIEARAGLARTFVVWQDAAAPLPAPADLALVVPIDPGVASRDLSHPGAAVVSQFEPGGRLSRILDATENLPLSWLVDPAVLDAARATTPPTTAGPTPTPTTSTTPGTATPQTAPPVPTPTPGGTTANPAGSRWLSRFVTGATGRQVLALPWADPDMAALARSAAKDRAQAVAATRALTIARTRMAATFGAVLTGSGTGSSWVGWPVGGQAGRTTAKGLVDGGARLALLADDALRVTGTTAPSKLPGPVVVATKEGTLPAMPVDATLSAEFAALGTGAGGQAQVSTMLAELAAGSLEGKSAGGTARIVATAPRGWDVEPQAVRALVATLQQTPWVALSQVPGAAPSSAPAATLRYPAAAAEAELPAAQVTAVTASLAQVQDFAPAMVKDPAPITDLSSRSLSLLAAAWRQEEAGPQAVARTGLATDVDSLYDGVQVVAGSSMLLLATSAKLPIRLSNDLPYRVVVELRLRPLSGQIDTPDPVLVDLRPNSDTTAIVPMRTRANGDVDVLAQVSVPGGPLLAADALRVKVRRNWESLALAITAVALGLLVLVGLLRSIRKERVRLRPEDTPDFDVLAAAEEERRNRESAMSGTGRGAPPADPPGPGTPGPGPDEADRDTVMLRPPSPEPGPPATAAEAGPTEDPRAGLGPELRVDVARSGAVMAAGTLVSRILGFARAALLAAAIGLQSHSGDAFQVANTVPNIVYMLLAGSVLNAVLVPAITRAARQGAKGRIFVDRLVTVSVAVMFGATVIVTVAAPIVVDLYTSRKVPAEQIALSVAFAYWCLPQVLFYGLYMVWGQVLNARGAFAAYTWAPVVNNVVAITGLVVYVVKYGAGAKPLDSWTPAGIALLAGTATLGVVAQAVILLPVMRRSGYVWRPRWGIRGVGLRTASTMAAWTFAAVVLTQVAYAVTSRVLTAAGDASLAAGGPIRTSLQIYSNAFLIYMLPHSIITVSLVTALFTRMSDAAGRGDTRAVRDDLSLGLRLTLLVTLPSTTFMLLMGPHVTAVLFPHNKAPETRGIALGAAAMMAGLAAYSAQYLVHRVFYAFEDARTPFYAQAPGVVLSVPLALAAGAFLPPGWVVVGIGLTISLSNLLGLALAAYLLRARLHSLDGARVTRVGVRVFLAAVVSAAACWGAALLAEPAVTALAGAGFLTEVVTLLVGVAVMAVVYWFALRALRVRELDELVRPILARVRRTTPAS